MFDLSPAEWTAVLLSLRIALVATAFALPFGIAIGWLLARKEFWGKTLLDGLVYLPLVLPPVVTGISAAHFVRKEGADRRLFGRSFRHRVLVPLDRSGAVLRHHGLSAHGPPDPACA